ncbi:hypothetical protein ACOSQ3_021814 [Xanthoceras sorbifolium]
MLHSPPSRRPPPVARAHRISPTKLSPVIAMAMVSTYFPQFTGLRRSCSKLETSSHSQSFLQHVTCHLRLFSSRKPSRSVVAMASNNKNGTKDFISKLVSDLNSAKLEADVGEIWFFFKLVAT